MKELFNRTKFLEAEWKCYSTRYYKADVKVKTQKMRKWKGECHKSDDVQIKMLNSATSKQNLKQKTC